MNNCHCIVCLMRIRTRMAIQCSHLMKRSKDHHQQSQGLHKSYRSNLHVKLDIDSELCFHSFKKVLYDLYYLHHCSFSNSLEHMNWVRSSLVTKMINKIVHSLVSKMLTSISLAPLHQYSSLEHRLMSIRLVRL